MTAAQIYEWSALGASPFIANVLLYLAIPTVTKRFPTTHQLVGWIALAVGLFFVIAPFTWDILFASINLVLTTAIFFFLWNWASKRVQQGNDTIPVLFFKGKPEYGENIIRI